AQGKENDLKNESDLKFAKKECCTGCLANWVIGDHHIDLVDHIGEMDYEKRFHIEAEALETKKHAHPLR
ncbi:MAG: hypothetical protein AAF570_07285, partial [Bacteroidota bacterium]